MKLLSINNTKTMKIYLKMDLFINLYYFKDMDFIRKGIIMNFNSIYSILYMYLPKKIYKRTNSIITTITLETRYVVY